MKLVLAVLVLLGLLGCQGAPPSSPSAAAAGAPAPAAPLPAGPPVSGPAAVATTGPATARAVGPAAGPERAGIPESAFAGHRPFSGPAVAEFGQPALLAAYEEMVGFAFQAGWDPALIRTAGPRLSTSDVAGIRTYLTPARRAAFDATVARVVRSDRAATRDLEDVAFFGITGAAGLVPARSGPVVTGRHFTEASVTPGRGAGRLSISFAARAAIQLQAGSGRRYALPTSRTVRYELVRNTGPTRADRPFLVDSWTIEVTVSRPAPAG